MHFTCLFITLLINSFKSLSGTKFVNSEFRDLIKVFDKFFRSEDFRTRESSGTGLGLYVTMKLANLIHAKISLVSELNKGSIFTIFVPNIE